jgi:hypothetical protein
VCILFIIFFVFNTDTYENGLNKLVTAQDTSNIEDEASSYELTEKKKKKRRINAKRQISSSSDEEYEDKRKSQTKKLLPPCPQLQDFKLRAPIENSDTSLVNNIKNNSKKLYTVLFTIC